MSSRSSSSSPDYHRKHRHKRRERSRSRSPGEHGEHSRPKHKKREDRHEKRHKKRQHKESLVSSSPEPHGRQIKEEVDDRPRRVDRGDRVRVKQEPGSGSDEDRREQARSRRENDARRRERRRARDQENSEELAFGEQAEDKEEPVEKEMPNFEVSGKLAEETNTFRGVVIKYSEPPEARKPKKRWRLYPFKDGESLPVLHIHRQSAFLMGRDRKIADFPIDHPSCSKQHAVLQYRFVPFTKPDGRRGHVVRPYIIDLGSTNGTHLNNQRIEAQKYVELKEQDVLKFGFSSREYVLLHDKSKGEEPEDDQGEDG